MGEPGRPVEGAWSAPTRKIRCDNAAIDPVTPTHPSPTGVTLSLARRGALIDLGARTGAVIIEDDRECEEPGPWIVAIVH